MKKKTTQKHLFFYIYVLYEQLPIETLLIPELTYTKSLTFRFFVYCFDQNFISNTYNKCLRLEDDLMSEKSRIMTNVIKLKMPAITRLKSCTIK